MKTCKTCGAVQDDSATVCNVCGVALDPETQEEAPINAKEPTAAVETEEPETKEEENIEIIEEIEVITEEKKTPVFKSFKAGFKDTYLGLCLLALTLIGGIILFASSPTLLMLDGEFYETLLGQLLVFGIIGIGAALTSRARGIDLSLASIMAFGGMIFIMNPTAVGMILAVLICALIGAINGLIINLFKLNSLLVTLLTGIVIRCMLAVIAGEAPLMLAPDSVELSTVVMVIVSVLILAAAIIFMLNTKLGVPMSKRDRANEDAKTRYQYFLAYIFAGFIAGFAGIFITYMMGGFIYSMVVPVHYELVILFAASCSLVSKAFDNKIMPVIIGFIGAMVFLITDLGFALANSATYISQMILAIITIIFAIIGIYVRKHDKIVIEETIIIDDKLVVGGEVVAEEIEIIQAEISEE